MRRGLKLLNGRIFTGGQLTNVFYKACLCFVILHHYAMPLAGNSDVPGITYKLIPVTLY